MPKPQGDYVTIGVYGGDLHTTTPVEVELTESILDYGGSPAEPAPDVYTQLLSRLEEVEHEVVTEEKVEEIVNDKVAESAVTLTDDQTIDGVKTFAQSPVVPYTPTDDNGAIGLLYFTENTLSDEDVASIAESVADAEIASKALAKTGGTCTGTLTFTNTLPLKFTNGGKDMRIQLTEGGSLQLINNYSASPKIGLTIGTTGSLFPIAAGTGANIGRADRTYANGYFDKLYVGGEEVKPSGSSEYITFSIGSPQEFVAGFFIGTTLNIDEGVSWYSYINNDMGHPSTFKGHDIFKTISGYDIYMYHPYTDDYHKIYEDIRLQKPVNLYDDIKGQKYYIDAFWD